MTRFDAQLSDIHIGSSEGKAEKISAEEELSFYKKWGFPYCDHKNGQAHGSQRIKDLLEKMNPSRKKEERLQTDPGYWAINLPLSKLPEIGCDDGVVSFTIHAYTLEELYAKAKAHIASLT